MNVPRLLSFGCAIAVIAAGTPAFAADYLFNFTGTAYDYVTPISGSGTLSTSDTANANGGYLITSLAGTFNNQTITGLLPVRNFYGNSNLLFPNGSSALDSDGVAFTLGSVKFNLYGYSDGYYIFNNNGEGASGLFTVQAVNAAVPEPATWALMLMGFGAVGFAMRRKGAASALPLLA